MINKDDIFTFTFLFRDEDEKVILITHGEDPAKTESEADTVLSSANEGDSEAVEKIISKIESFRDAEPGSEETVTGSLHDFEDRYDISLEDMEDETGEDLGSESSEEKSEKSETDSDEEIEEPVEDEDEPEDAAILAIHVISDPMAALPEPSEVRSYLTNPMAFLDEEEEEPTEVEEEYEPFAAHTLDGSMELEEKATPQEAISKLVSTARAQNKYMFSVAELTQLFTTLNIVEPEAKYTILKMALSGGSVKLFRTPGKPAIHGRLAIPGEPILVIGTPVGLPEGSTEIENPNDLKQAISQLAGI